MRRLACIALLSVLAAAAHAGEIRVGIIGCDTSHATAFTELLNDPAAKDHVPGARVIAGFKAASPDIESSISRVDEYVKELTEKRGVTFYPSIEEMCRHVDAVMIESVDGRPHLAQARPVIDAGKPLFIDKPAGGSLADVLEIYRLAEAKKVPVFSSSALRFAAGTRAVRSGSIGPVKSAETTSPSPLEKTHPDLFWYGVHGCESLFTVMGTGCVSVKRTTTAEGKIQVIGSWSGDRRGIFTEGKTYSGQAIGEKGTAAVGTFDGYAPLVAEIVRFYETRQPPVSSAETIELFTFMEAADESKRQGGKEIVLADVLAKTRAAAPSSPAPAPAGK